MKDWVEQVEKMSLEDFNAMLFRFLDKYKKAEFIQKLLNSVQKKRDDSDEDKSITNFWKDLTNKVKRDDKDTKNYNYFTKNHEHNFNKATNYEFGKGWIAFGEDNDNKNEG